MSPRTVNLFFGLLTFVALAVAAASWGTAFVARRRDDLRARLEADTGSALRWMAFAVAFVTSAGSLYYSESRGFLPCELCWLQRDLMYPLVVVILVGTLRRDRSLGWFVLPFAVVGPLVSAYHLLVENVDWFKEGASCSAVSCSEPPIRIIFHFVTLAFMALSAFLAIGGLIALDAVAHRDDPERSDARGGATALRVGALLVAAIPLVVGLYQTQIQGEYPSDQLWYARVAAYPVVFVIAVGLARRSALLAWYALPFVAVALGLLGWYLLAPPELADPTGWWAALAAAALVVVAVLIVLDARTPSVPYSEGDAISGGRANKNGVSAPGDLEESK